MKLISFMIYERFALLQDTSIKRFSNLYLTQFICCSDVSRKSKDKENKKREIKSGITIKAKKPREP
jgi:hypothetical protein